MTEKEHHKKEEILPHITLEPEDILRRAGVSRGFGSITAKPIGVGEFKNMLGQAISVQHVMAERLKNTYFLIDLTTEYHSPAVSEMLKSLGVEIKTVLSESKIIVGGDKAALQKISERDNIPKKITNSIRSIQQLDAETKVGKGLLDLMRSDVHGTKIFPITIRLIDNLSPEEERDCINVLGTDLKRDAAPQYLSRSKQFVCGSSAKRIIEITKLPFVKSVNRIPRIQHQTTDDDVVYHNKKNVVLHKANPAPVICVLDSGVSDVLKPYCHSIDPYTYKTPDDDVGHGTKVGSVAVFGEDLTSGATTITQQALIIPVKIDDGNDPAFIDEAIMAAVEKHKPSTKIFCISYNLLDDVDEDYRLDMVKRLDLYLQQQNIILVNSGGNINMLEAYHKKSNYPAYLATYPVLSPAEAKNIFSVGAICNTSTPVQCNVSKISRMGLHPIFQRDDLDKYRFFKPDVYAFGGNSDLILQGRGILPSPALEVPVLNKNGDVVYDIGTSYAAPMVALCFARLCAIYKHKNVETYKAILLNKAHYAEINSLPTFYLLDTKRIATCSNGVYLNFEGEVTPKYRAEDAKSTNIFECKSVEFYMPEEAESIDIVTVHSNNYKFQDLRKYNTRLVIELVKASGTTIKKEYGTISRNCANTYAHYGFSRNYNGMWFCKVHVETRGIPKESLKGMRVRFGVSIRINLKSTHTERIREVHDEVLQKTRQHVAAKTKHVKADVEVDLIAQEAATKSAKGVA